MPRTYKLSELVPAIRDYVERAANRATTHGLVPAIGTEWSDLVRVKSGRLDTSISSKKGAAPGVSDPGQAPGNYATDYPPRHYGPPTRKSLIDGVRGAKFREPLAVFNDVPYGEARESIDNNVEPAIAAAQANWPRTAKTATVNVRPR